MRSIRRRADVPVTVTPDSFEYVDYVHEEIQILAEECARDAGLPDDANIHVDVVESSPLGRVKLEEFSPGPPPTIHLRVEGGAFENLKAPRQFDAVRCRESLGRFFFRLADALDQGFDFDGEFENLPVPRQVAWDVYALGRMNNKGYKVSHDRWLYLFRNRHGFTDDSDLFFEKLWKGDELTWAEIKGESEKLKSDEEIKAASSRRGTAAARAGRAG